MRNVKLFIIVSTMSAISGAAFAADLPLAPPPYIPPVVEFGGWYLRGDIGSSNQSVDNIRYKREAAYIPVESLNQTSTFGSAGIFDLGVGYQFNSWFRGDVTGQYRGNSNFTATDRFICGGACGQPGIDNYSGSKSEWVVMANGYFDLGTWGGVTPFVGAGVGAARVTINGLTDTGVNSINGIVQNGGTSFASAPGNSRWNFAWAAHAGLAYRVSPSLTLELAYTYLDMGSGQSGVLTGVGATNPENAAAFKFKDLTSHDLTLGVRWAIDPVPAYAPGPPLITKG